MTLVNTQTCLWSLWKTFCVFQDVVGAFFRVHRVGSVHRRFVGSRAAETTDDRGRFDDESR